MKKITHTSLGFTLIELLAVSVVIIIVSSVISAILFSSLRGVSKTNITDSVRQNGNTAISKISREVKFAKNFRGVSNADVDDQYVVDCSVYGIVPAPTPVPYKFLRITNLDNQLLVYSCEDDSSGASIFEKIDTSAKKSLLDTDTVAMPIGSCFFTCTQNVVTDPPTIGIQFSLEEENSTTSFFEQKSSADFQTSVTFRNLNK